MKRLLQLLALYLGIGIAHATAPSIVYEPEGLSACAPIEAIAVVANTDSEALEQLSVAAEKIGGNFILRETDGPDEIVLHGSVTYRGNVYLCDDSFIYAPIFQKGKPCAGIGGSHFTDSPIGKVQTESGSFSVSLGMNVRDEVLSFDYQLEYETWVQNSSVTRSYSYTNIEELSAALKEAVVAAYKNSGYEKEVKLGNIWGDRKTAGKVLVMPETKNVLFVWIGSSEDFRIVMGIGTAMQLSQYLDNSIDIVGRLTPHVMAFNNVPTSGFDYSSCRNY